MKRNILFGLGAYLVTSLGLILIGLRRFFIGTLSSSWFSDQSTAFTPDSPPAATASAGSAPPSTPASASPSSISLVSFFEASSKSPTRSEKKELIYLFVFRYLFDWNVPSPTIKRLLMQNAQVLAKARLLYDFACHETNKTMAIWLDFVG